MLVIDAKMGIIRAPMAHLFAYFVMLAIIAPRLFNQNVLVVVIQPLVLQLVVLVRRELTVLSDRLIAQCVLMAIFVLIQS